MPSRSHSRPHSRPKKITSKSAKKNLKHTTNSIHHSTPTLQLHELSGCETASATCQSHCTDQYTLAEEEERQKVSTDLNQMADSSNGKYEGTQNVQPDDVVESVRDIAIDEKSEPPKKPRDADDSSSSSSSSDEEAEPAEKSPQVVVDSGEVEETKEVSVPVVETVETLSNHLDQGVVDDLVSKEGEGKVLPSLDATSESSPAIADWVSNQIEEKTVSYMDNGVSEIEEPALPSLTENDEPAPVEETEVSCSDEKIEVAAAVADVVSTGVEETKLEALEEKIGEASGAAYKESSENVEDVSSKALPEVPPVESTDAAQEYGNPEIAESTGNPYIVSVTRSPLQPTSWRSCCGLFEVLRRSDR